MSSSSYVHVAYEAVCAMTAKAVQIRRPGGELLWLPLSVVADSDEIELGEGTGTLSVQGWFAAKEGIEEDDE